MKLALIFACTFFGAILVAVAFMAFFRGISKLMEWLKVKTGRSDSDILAAVMIVLMALFIAGGVTVSIAVDANSSSAAQAKASK